MDFGQAEFGELSPSERLRRYRQYLYEAGLPQRCINNMTTDGQRSVLMIDMEILHDLLDLTDGAFQESCRICHAAYPFGKTGGLRSLRCQGIAVDDYGFALGASALKPSGFCKVGVYAIDRRTNPPKPSTIKLSKKNRRKVLR